MLHGHVTYIQRPFSFPTERIAPTGNGGLMVFPFPTKEMDVLVSVPDRRYNVSTPRNGDVRSR